MQKPMYIKLEKQALGILTKVLHNPCFNRYLLGDKNIYA